MTQELHSGVIKNNKVDPTKDQNKKSMTTTPEHPDDNLENSGKYEELHLVKVK